ncbi:hypothetical protein CDAR_453311 [Caerostris darwini]|uniref:Uncharacterized protein n=1 Tax=Caerostris darwini TaxID=1538125 RepID=A0AAV4TGQ2_9ARAC|nr:hypothetical protein CDAR_453311 [Caerostris darwini]
MCRAVKNNRVSKRRTAPSIPAFRILAYLGITTSIRKKKSVVETWVDAISITTRSGTFTRPIVWRGWSKGLRWGWVV